MKLRLAARTATLTAAVAAAALVGVAASTAASASPSPATAARPAASATVTASQIKPRAMYLVGAFSTAANCDALKVEFPIGAIFEGGVIYDTACVPVLVPPSTVDVWQLWVFTNPLSCNVRRQAADSPSDCIT